VTAEVPCALCDRRRRQPPPPPSLESAPLSVCGDCHDLAAAALAAADGEECGNYVEGMLNELVSPSPSSQSSKREERERKSERGREKCFARATLSLSPLSLSLWEEREGGREENNKLSPSLTDKEELFLAPRLEKGEVKREKEVNRRRNKRKKGWPLFDQLNCWKGQWRKAILTTDDLFFCS